MSFDALLILYDTSSTETIGFADNLCLLQAGIDLGTVTCQAQFSINKAVKWATDRGHTFCPKKTAMLLFTKKKQSSYKITKHFMAMSSLNVKAHVQCSTAHYYS
jgi:hypothetical protein